MNKAKEIIEKYGLIPNSYYTESPYKKRELWPEEDWDNILFNKWHDHIPDGWYGFSLGLLPDKCCEALDEMLDYIKTVHPDFEIYQIKTKFNSVRIYIGNVSEDLYKQCEELADAMTDEFLMY